MKKIFSFQATLRIFTFYSKFQSMSNVRKLKNGLFIQACIEFNFRKESVKKKFRNLFGYLHDPDLSEALIFQKKFFFKN